MSVAVWIFAALAVLLLLFLAAAIRILREYERGVIFRLGRLIAQKGALMTLGVERRAGCRMRFAPISAAG